MKRFLGLIWFLVNSTLRVSLLFYSDISYYSNKTRLDTVPKMYLESQHPFAHFIHLLKQYHFSKKLISFMI